MKIINKTLIASAILVLSSQVFADTDVHQKNRVLQTADTITQSAAYETALEKLQALETESSTELNHELSLSAASRNVSLNEGAYITVLEKMGDNGEMLYNGLVHVSVSFTGLN